MIRRRRFHRTVFALAAAYNLAWAVWFISDTARVERILALPTSAAPEAFAGLAMVVGLYGFVYLEVARAPERGWPLAAVGLIGKVVGPFAVLSFVMAGTWPARTLAMTLTNDLAWWVPFALYLRDAWPAFRGDLRAWSSGSPER